MEQINVLSKKDTPSTPLVIKIIVVLEIWFLASGIVTQLKTLNGQILLPAVLIIIQIVSLVGIWKLRRWGFYSWIILSIINILMMFFMPAIYPSLRISTMIIMFRLIPIIIALIYWSRFI